jgi:hypothetical protein
MEICYKLVWEGSRGRGPDNQVLIGFQVYRYLPPVEHMYLEFPIKKSKEQPEEDIFTPTFMVTEYRNRADTGETTLCLLLIQDATMPQEQKLLEQRAVIKILRKDYDWEWDNPY